MSDIIPPQRVHLTDHAATTTLRDFLRGGYQHISQPTVITYHAAILGTFVPGVIASSYEWRPSALLGADAPRTDAAAQPDAPVALARRAVTSLFSAAPAQEPGPRTAYRRLRASTTPSYFLAPASDTVHAEPPILTPTSSDPDWLTGKPGRPKHRS